MSFARGLVEERGRAIADPPLRSATSHLLTLRFALPIFFGAFLLFQVQLLMGKYILPWFGGASSAWATCMLFFQFLLLCGYAYAHLSAKYLSPRAQAVLHGTLMLVAVALMPITPSGAWKPHDGSYPALRIMLLLAATTGLPFFVLSSTSPLLQEWFSLLTPGRQPFRFYALSNLGSLLGLVSYPVWFEYAFPRRTQAELWSMGLLVFVVVCGACAMEIWSRNPATPPFSPSTSEGEGKLKPNIGRWALWLALPACSSALLLATTNKLCQEVASIPLLWVVPLVIYLLSLIVCFDNPRWYSRVVWAVLLVPCLATTCMALYGSDDLPIVEQVLIHSATLLTCCMMCHGELYRLRPSPRFLTGYYLSMAAGGVVGGCFVAVVAPLLFNSFSELQWGLGVCLVLFLTICAFDKEALDNRGWMVLAIFYALLAYAVIDHVTAWRVGLMEADPAKHGWRMLSGVNWHYVANVRCVACCVAGMAAIAVYVKRDRWLACNWHVVACSLLAVSTGVVCVVLSLQSWYAGRGGMDKVRNFYGTLSLWEYYPDKPYDHFIALQHGSITHGLQFVDENYSSWPTAYYCEDSGVGLALLHVQKRPRSVIGVVGLGVGTLAAYGREGDLFRFYEINPAVLMIAQDRFSYLRQCPATVQVVLGDARLSLEREPSQQFDLLVLDAFSSDAIPAHLLTLEAFETYQRHLRADGIIAVHLSNRYLNLESVVAAVGSRLGLKWVLVKVEDEDTARRSYPSVWMLLTKDERFLRSGAVRRAQGDPDEIGCRASLWTDDYSSVFGVIKEVEETRFLSLGKIIGL